MDSIIAYCCVVFYTQGIAISLTVPTQHLFKLRLDIAKQEYTY